MVPSTLPVDATQQPGAVDVGSANVAVGPGVGGGGQAPQPDNGGTGMGVGGATAGVGGGVGLPLGGGCRRIQVSREKRPLNFFVTLSKKFLQTDEVIELSGLGLAVTTVVTIAEILKTAGLVVLDHIETSLVEPHPEGHSSAPKAKIQIWLRKTAQFDALVASTMTNTAPGGPQNNNNNNNSHHHHHHQQQHQQQQQHHSNNNHGGRSRGGGGGNNHNSSHNNNSNNSNATGAKAAAHAAKMAESDVIGDAGSTKPPAPDELPLPLRGDRAVSADAA